MERIDIGVYFLDEILRELFSEGNIYKPEFFATKNSVPPNYPLAHKKIAGKSEIIPRKY